MQKPIWQRIRFIRWYLCLVLLAAVLAFLVGMREQRLERSQAAVTTQATCNDADVTLNDFNYCDVREGQSRCTVQATLACYFDDRQETVVRPVKAEFFLEDGSKVELWGDEGVLHNDSKNMELSGNVRLQSEDGYRVVTERLIYDRERGLFHTPAAVLVEGQGLVLRGLGMRLDMDGRTLSVLKHIETTLQGILSFDGQRNRSS
ncbi:MAG: LPS export ABC transporter periplasmic protein LptC [Deltaproteobacteria bacterium]|nr:MAG: LPS export ABC transporter periplasmic protein LptC [Deltaproteobacteria bacterium]